MAPTSRRLWLPRAVGQAAARRSALDGSPIAAAQPDLHWWCYPKAAGAHEPAVPAFLLTCTHLTCPGPAHSSELTDDDVRTAIKNSGGIKGGWVGQPGNAEHAIGQACRFSCFWPVACGVGAVLVFRPGLTSLSYATQGSLLIPEAPFELLVRRAIERLLPPALQVRWGGGRMVGVPVAEFERLVALPAATPASLLLTLPCSARTLCTASCCASPASARRPRSSASRSWG